MKISVSTTEARLPGQRVERPVFALGDIHGQLDLLEAAQAVVRDRARPGEALVYLGDLIDRGPSSLACLRAARDGLAHLERIWLGGNHEQMAEAALSDREALAIWIGNGGRHVIEEWREDRRLAGEDPSLPFEWPEAELAFLRSMEGHWRNGDVLFVHAGIHPSIPLGEQLETGLGSFDRVLQQGENRSTRWIRGPFLNHESAFQEGLFVVHGHTINPDEPRIEGHRLCLDLGSYARGRTGLAEIRGDRVLIHTISRE